MAYKTKTQKKNALKAIDQRARKLFLSGVFSDAQYRSVTKAVMAGMKKL